MRFEQEGLVGELDRVAVAEVHLELCRPGLVRHGGDLDARGLAIVVHLIDDVIVVVWHARCVGLAAALLAAGKTDGNFERHGPGRRSGR